MQSPVWRFTTLDPTATTRDSVALSPTSWGYTTGATNQCNAAFFQSTLINLAVMQWPVPRRSWS